MKLILLLLATFIGFAAEPPRPNVVLIYADDLGYGDISCNEATRIQTPYIDRLAREGLRFTDAHSPAATCTPSRYAMLTGEYAFRRRGTGVLPGDAKLIIEPGRATLASLFKDAGYQTAVVGKWHLGLGDGNVNWNGEIKPGPLEIGFNYCFLMPATGDRTPCVYVENHRVVGLDAKDPIQVRYDAPFPNQPTGRANPELLSTHPSHGHDQTIVNGISRIGYMTGGKSALWKDETMADVFTEKAIAFIEQNRARPFFLFFAAHDIHVPRVPHPRFVGKTTMGPRGDVIAQLDWSVSEITKALDRLGLAQDTIVIFTSDNGPVIDDGYKDESVERLGDHKPSGPFRGGKYSAFEAGTRVPFILRWPVKVKPGTSEALVCQVDFIASFAKLLDRQFPTNTAPDTINILPALLGESKQGREHLIEQAGLLSVRHNNWKYIPPGGGRRVSLNTNTETGQDPAGQLYDLSTDPAEKNNLITAHPERARELADYLRKTRGPAPR